MEFRVEKARTIWLEAMTLVTAHNAEVGLQTTAYPDAGKFFALEDAGVSRIFTLRNEGRLVGYQVLLVGGSLHYAGSLCAFEEAVFLERSARGVAGHRFLKDADDTLAAQGVQMIFRHVTAGHDHSRMLERMGYNFQEKIFVRKF